MPLLPFASPAWLEALQGELVDAFAQAPPDEAFSFGERYVSGQDRSRGWHVRWAEGRSTFVAVPAEDVDVELVIDFEVARRSCSPMTTELAQIHREAVADGRILWRGDPQRIPWALRSLHDRMIPLTSPS